MVYSLMKSTHGWRSSGRVHPVVRVLLFHVAWRIRIPCRSFHSCSLPQFTRPNFSIRGLDFRFHKLQESRNPQNHSKMKNNSKASRNYVRSLQFLNLQQLDSLSPKNQNKLLLLRWPPCFFLFIAVVGSGGIPTTNVRPCQLQPLFERRSATRNTSKSFDPIAMTVVAGFPYTNIPSIFRSAFSM